jgi:methylmalonyl-CoA/ethylmalonyl-CoA epimerase
MIHRIEHLGIAVADPALALTVFEKLLNRPPEKTEEVESEKVRTHFFRVGESQIELLESLNPEGVISRYIEKRGQGIHHLAFYTSGLEEEIQRLQAAGFEFLNPEPKPGADGKRIVFLHPRSTAGVLVELCEDIVSPS